MRMRYSSISILIPGVGERIRGRRKKKKAEKERDADVNSEGEEYEDKEEIWKAPVDPRPELGE